MQKAKDAAMRAMGRDSASQGRSDGDMKDGVSADARGNVGNASSVSSSSFAGTSMSASGRRSHGTFHQN
jgi:hypothetical protein